MKEFFYKYEYILEHPIQNKYFLCYSLRSYNPTEAAANLLNKINKEDCDHFENQTPFFTKNRIVRLCDGIVFRKFLRLGSSILRKEKTDFKDHVGLFKVNNNKSALPF